MWVWLIPPPPLSLQNRPPPFFGVSPLDLSSQLRKTSKKSIRYIKLFNTTHIIFQVQMLQEQVGHLAESQATTDDRYSKVKQENQTLTQK